MIGDKDDMADRIRRELPRRWFGDNTPRPTLDAILAGLGTAWASLHGYLAYIAQQSRIATATDSFLDMLAHDFLGDTLVRLPHEIDAFFRGRIRREILREKATRAALVADLIDLTGQQPWVFEPANADDTGGYDTGYLGYDIGGGYGSLTMPFECLVVAYRPLNPGIPAIDGYDGAGIGGYDTGAIEYLAETDFQGVSDEQIRSAILGVIPAAVVVWSHVADVNTGTAAVLLDVDFELDISLLG